VGSIVFLSIHVPRNSHSDWRSGVRVHHCGDERCTPSSHWRLLPGRIHALMMASNVSAARSATGARQVSPIPAWHQQKPTLSRATGRNYTSACWSIYHIFPQLYHPLPPTIKKSCKEQMKIKFDIALRQNCDQSAKVWWSTQSSAQLWRVGEWRLTWNESTGSNREPT